MRARLGAGVRQRGTPRVDPSAGLTQARWSGPVTRTSGVRNRHSSPTLHTFPAHFSRAGARMSKNKTPTVPEGSGMGDQDDINASSPATRLLDALGRGDLN